MEAMTITTALNKIKTSTFHTTDLFASRIAAFSLGRCRLLVSYILNVQPVISGRGKKKFSTGFATEAMAKKIILCLTAQPLSRLFVSKNFYFFNDISGADNFLISLFTGRHLFTYN